MNKEASSLAASAIEEYRADQEEIRHMVIRQQRIRYRAAERRILQARRQQKYRSAGRKAA